jgi:hypothetical protein
MPGHAVLTEEKLREIISLANRGLSRRAIARQVGCAAATIDNTAARRPEFAAELAAVEQRFTRTHPGNIDRYSAKTHPTSNWLLHTLSPEEFAQLTREFHDWARDILELVPPEDRPPVERAVRDLLSKLPPLPADLEGQEEQMDDAGPPVDVPEPSAATADPLHTPRFAFPASPGADPLTTASPPPHREPDGPRSPETSVADAIRALNSVLPPSPARAGRPRPVDPRPVDPQLVQPLNMNRST